MKFVALVLSLCFTMNVMASTGTISALEKSLDNYQYALTVEWDQKDQAFYEKTTNAFFTEMTSLMSQGMTKEAVLKVLELKMQNKELVKAVNVKLSLMGDNLSPETLVQVVKDEAKNLYAAGASWNGDVVLWGAGILIVAALAYTIWWNATHECVSYNTDYVCGSPSEVYGHQCWYQEYCELYEKKD